jgi:hypothetical protein
MKLQTSTINRAAFPAFRRLWSHPFLFPFLDLGDNIWREGSGQNIAKKAFLPPVSSICPFLLVHKC